MTESAHEVGEGESPLQRPISILAIDLGETTGLAFLDVRDNYIGCTTFANPRDAANLIPLLKPAIIVLERFPESYNLATGIHTAYLEIASHSNVFLVSPGNWKPFTRAVEFLYPPKLSQHERDASDMLRFYFWNRYREDIRWMFVRQF